MTSGGDFHEDQCIKLLLKNANTIMLTASIDSNETGGLISTNIIWSHVIVRYNTEDTTQKTKGSQ